MVVLRCTSKLQKRCRLKLEARTAEQASHGRLGDWSCNLVYIGRVQTILCVNHLTRLPIFLPAAEAKTFPQRLSQALSHMLATYKIPADVIEEECRRFDEILLAKTNNRSVTGSMNDFARMTQWYEVSTADDSLTALSLLLAETPCKPLNYNSPDREVIALLTN